MADIFDFYVYDDRSIRFAIAEPIMLEDKDVTQFRFRIPKVLNNIDMSDWEWWFIFVNAKKVKYTTQLTLEDDEDDPDNFSVATYTVGYGFSGYVGSVSFSIEALNVSGEDIVNEWHTRTYNTHVIDTLQGTRAVVPEPGGQAGTGLTEAMKQALLQIAQKVAYIDEHGQTYYNALYNALYPPASLVSISAVYTQSGIVYNTDTLDSLKPDLVVTAYYDNQTSAVVTNYTLSGTLLVGTSTITVSYGGKTASFNVTVTKGLDYTEDALEDVTWLDGYTYNATTGALEAAEGEHCSEKFTAQELIHKITIGASDQYPRLFVWDANDNYLGYVQHDTTVPSNWMLMPEYKYALKVYNTGTFDSTAISCIPVDNRETAVPSFELKLTDYLDSMKKSGDNYEFPCNTIMQSFGVSSSNWNTAINRVDKLTNIQYNGYSLGQKCPFSVPFKMCFYQNTAFVFNTTPAQSSLEAMKEYITTNDIRIKFNY